MEYLASIKHVVSSLFFSLALLSGGSYTQPVTINNPVVDRVETVREVPVLGSTISAAADFRTSLQSGISSSATSMTLVSLTSGSETLTSGGLYGFKLGGREYVLGYVSTTTANTIVYMTRGISRKTGTTTVSAYQSDWGRGTSVEITDAPLLLDLTEKANGVVGYENPLKYVSGLATTTIDDSPQNLVNYELLTYTAFNAAGAVDATSVQKGLVELATQLETASSSSAGTSGNLAIPSSNATSTHNSATAALRVVVTQNNGKIDPYFIATSSLGIVASSSQIISGIPLLNIGKHQQVFTNSGTFTVPSGIQKVSVEVVAGGGAGGEFTTGESSGANGTDSRFSTFIIAGGGTGGGNGNSGGANARGGGGGAPGAYCRAMVDVSATTSIQVTVGAGGSGTRADSSDFGLGGDAGTCTGSASNIFTLATAGFDSPLLTVQGQGGSGPYGYGAALVSTASKGYGAGGVGKISGTTAQAGTAGIVIITW